MIKITCEGQKIQYTISVGKDLQEWSVVPSILQVLDAVHQTLWKVIWYGT